MKVQDIMQSQSPAIWVEDDLPIKSLARLVFSANLSGFPVVHKSKLIGFITEEDVFSHIYNSQGKEILSGKEVAGLLEKPVKTIMVKNPIYVTPEMNIVDAQLLMYKNNFTRLPVVDKNMVLLGVLGRSDVFRYILKNEIPKLEQGQYASFMSSHYDQIVDWDKREELEFPTLLRIFKNNKVKKIIDMGSWTGEYAIRLAREGIETIGLDHNELMISLSNSKKSKLPDNIKGCVSFQLTDFSDFSQFKSGSIDAVIGVGTSLAYLPQKPEFILENVHKIIKKDGVIVLQLLNLERVMEDKGGFLNFRIKKNGSSEELFIEFFDRKNEDTLMHNVINFTKDGDRWIYAGINSIEIHYIKNDEVATLLQKAGFKDISITGNKGEYRGEFGQMSLVKPFYPQTSEWMTVIAKA